MGRGEGGRGEGRERGELKGELTRMFEHLVDLCDVIQALCDRVTPHNVCQMICLYARV